jgi:hypothetical protein
MFMKKVMAFLLAILVFFNVGGFSFAGDDSFEDGSIAELSDSQRTFLLANGLDDEQIAVLTIGELRNIVRNPQIVSPDLIINPDLPSDGAIIASDLQEQLFQRGIDESFIKTLYHLGYTYEQMLNIPDEELLELKSKLSMSTETLSVSASSSYLGSVKNLLRPNSLFAAAGDADDPAYTGTYPLPTGTTNTVSQLVTGSVNGVSELFHNNVSVTASDISWYRSASQTAGAYIFNCSTSDSNFRYDYYLYGEYDSSIGIHEGVDLQYMNSTTRQVKSISDSSKPNYPARVVSTSTSLGSVCVYDPYMDETLVLRFI